MTNVAAVSVIIPCYRCAPTLERALRSVAAQTLPPAEIIVVDDASDEDAPQLNDSPVHGLRQLRLSQNAGPGAARNAGWAIATQPYLAFLDADDAWHPKKLELQLGWMQAHSDCLLSGHRIEGRMFADVTVGNAVEVTAAMLLFSNRFQTSSVVLRRLIPQRFVQQKRYCEDYHLWLEIVLSGGQAIFLDAPLAMRFKPVYGASGASGRLWQMERGELDALTRARRAGLLSTPTYLAASGWSLAKFLRRLLRRRFST